MGSYVSSASPAHTSGKRSMHVLIAGGGIVGLTIAQGCRENGIPYTLFERDTEGSRSQGWALTLHWCLEALERTIGPERAAKLPGAVVDQTLKEDAGNFLFLNCETGETKYKIPPSKRRLRLHRQKMRAVLADGINVQEGKKLERVEEIDNGQAIRAHFKDGTFADGTILIGADGNNSNVRQFLLPNSYELNRLPVTLIGAIRHFTADQGEAVRAIDPLLFQGLHPKSENYLWYSIQEVCQEPDGRVSFDALVLVSWIFKDAATDTIPASNRDRIAMMKSRSLDWAEPLRSIVQDIPDDLDFTTPLRLGDFPCPDWDNHNGLVTLAGDSAHAMTMFRGEGANHGILDAALLVDQLKRIYAGKLDQKTAITAYEAEMRPRTHDAVLKSRAAALMAHEWDKVTEDSPVIGARIAPVSAFKSPFA